MCIDLADVDLDTSVAALTIAIICSFVKITSETTKDAPFVVVYKIPLFVADALRWIIDRIVLTCTDKKAAASS